MQIAPMSVVFALASLGVLGMAVKDTVMGHADEAASRAMDESRSDEIDPMHEAEQNEILEAEREAELRAARHEKREAYAIFGTEKASLGPPLFELKLGGPVEDPEGSDLQLAAAEANLDVYTFGDEVLDMVRVESSTDDDDEWCARIIRSRTEAWGAPFTDDDGEAVWWNEATGQRARIKYGYSCRIEFEQAVAPAAWADRVLAIGKAGTRAKLATVLVESKRAMHEGDDTAWWEEPGLADGTNRTEYTVEFVGDQVPSVEAKVSAPAGTLDQVLARLESKLGKPVVEDSWYAWKKQAVTAERHGSFLTVKLGKIAAEEIE